MTLDLPACWAALGAGGHGVLGTVHPARGVDAVPVVFVVLDRLIMIPVDTVKPKRSARLQRVTNLSHDDRCVLLVDHYDDDWERLWWVRVHGRGVAGPPRRAAMAALAGRFPAYQRPAAVAAVITLSPSELTGWSGAR